MEEQEILRQFEARRASARLELAWLDAEIALMEARRQALGRFLQGLDDVDVATDSRPQQRLDSPAMPLPSEPAAAQTSSAAPKPPVSRGRSAKKRGRRATSVEPDTSAPESDKGSNLRDVILAVLRKAAPEALQVGEIGRLAKAEMGSTTLEKTPGTILNALKKQGLVERAGHRWRLSSEI